MHTLMTAVSKPEVGGHKYREREFKLGTLADIRGKALSQKHRGVGWVTEGTRRVDERAHFNGHIPLFYTDTQMTNEDVGLCWGRPPVHIWGSGRYCGAGASTQSGHNSRENGLRWPTAERMD